MLDRDNTASDVWADTAYRSAANLALLDHRGLKPQFQRKKPRGRRMPARLARGDATRARGSSTSLPRRNAGWASSCGPSAWCAPVKIGLANLAYNFTRLARLNRRGAPA